jgi:hypothetical protein
VGALLRGAKCVHINRVCSHLTSLSLRTRDILVKGKKHPWDQICADAYIISFLLIIIIIINMLMPAPMIV